MLIITTISDNYNRDCCNTLQKFWKEFQHPPLSLQDPFFIMLTAVLNSDIFIFQEENLQPLREGGHLPF